ncbi:MAG: DUF1835 domain-containing protein [Pseudomonadota bacterium]
MGNLLHITSGDIAGASLNKAGLAGEVFVWHDILCDGPRSPGWTDDDTLKARAQFLEGVTGGGLNRGVVLSTLRGQYDKLAAAGAHNGIALWFDACLFDQSMLAHILMCLRHQRIDDAALLCVDTAFASLDLSLLTELSQTADAPLPWIAAAAARWLQERPAPATGLGRLESLALAAIRDGCQTPGEIFATVAAADTPPQFWGDTMLWAKINALARREPPLVRIAGPADRLPQWESVPAAEGLQDQAGTGYRVNSHMTPERLFCR